MSEIIAIWDGLEIREVPRSEADQLVREDKAEIMIGNALKYRHQFTGYITRELRADSSPLPSPSLETPAVEEAALNWQDFKDRYKTATGKKRATQSAVELWMSEEGIG